MNGIQMSPSVPKVVEGNFTPGFEFSGGSTGVVVDHASGHYIRIGKWVMFTLNIGLSSKGSSTGDARITGLPFVEGGTPAGGRIFATRFSALAVTTIHGAYACVNSGTTVIELSKMSAGVIGLLQHSDITDTAGFRISGGYRIA